MKKTFSFFIALTVLFGLSVADLTFAATRFSGNGMMGGSMWGGRGMSMPFGYMMGNTRSSYGNMMGYPYMMGGQGGSGCPFSGSQNYQMPGNYFGGSYNYGRQLTSPNGTTAVTPSNVSAMEKQVFDLINQHRQSIGLSALTWNDAAYQQAKQHSQDMANKTVAFGHDGFDTRVSNIKTAVSNSSSFAENVAMNKGYSDPSQNAVTGWLNSPEHKKNLEGNYSLSAVGVVQSSDGTYYFTQLFVN